MVALTKYLSNVLAVDEKTMPQITAEILFFRRLRRVLTPVIVRHVFYVPGPQFLFFLVIFGVHFMVIVADDVEAF